jgi:signal transduction histidine kinase
LAIAGKVWLDGRYTEQALGELRLDAEIVRSAFDLQILADQWLADPQERALLQWNAKNAALAKLLRQISESGRTDGRSIDELHQDHSRVRTLFGDIVQIRQENGVVPGPGMSRVEQDLKQMLNVKLQSMVSKASSTYRASESAVMITTRGSVEALLVLLILMLLIILGNWIQAHRAIIYPLGVLAHGAEIIGSGNLEHTVDIRSKDEVGKVASSFNQMAANLKETISRVEQEIKERRQAELALQEQAAELERSNADLEQFAYAASHDLQEPLRNISSCMQMLERWYKDSLGNEGKQLVAYAVESANRMKDLINDLLIYSRVGARGKEFQETDTARVVDSAVANLRLAIIESGAMITRDDLPRILADDILLVQVFQNLISNAVKFRGRDDLQIHVSAEQRDSECVFSVRDNGIGIEPEFFERIFMIFQRLHTRAEYPGTGIGLALVKRILDHHGGKIWVESEYGKGSTFFFTIPDRR